MATAKCRTSSHMIHSFPHHPIVANLLTATIPQEEIASVLSDDNEHM